LTKNTRILEKHAASFHIARNIKTILDLKITGNDRL
jgi:hypothetical protein